MTRNEKLELLAKRLIKVAGEQERGRLQRVFNLAFWYMPQETNSCGSSACAVGEACLMREFKELGLKIVPNTNAWGSPVYSPFYNGLYDWLAVENFFGLSERQAEYLFMLEEYSKYARPRDVAARIREFIKEPVAA